MVLVDDRIISAVIEKPLEIDTSFLSFGLLFLVGGCIGLLLWVSRNE